MVESGALSGEKVDAWKAKLADEEEVAAMRGRAEAGDGAQMYRLGLAYQHGTTGLARDVGQALEWYFKSYEAGTSEGPAALGQCYAERVGVSQPCAVRAGMPRAVCSR